MTRVLQEAWRHLVAQPVSAVVTMLAIAHALLFAGLAVWVGQQTATASDALAAGLVVTVSLDPALDAAGVKATADALAAPDEVAVVTIRTPKEERERLAATLGPDLLNGLDDLALPSPVTVDLRLDPGSLDAAGLERLDALVQKLAAVQGVIALPWDPGHIQTLLAFSTMVRWLGFGLGLTALVLALALAAQLVRRRLEHGREAAELALAFGATSRWLELPHFASAGLVGALGAVVALLAAGLLQDRLLAVARLVPGLADAAPILAMPYFAWCLVGGLGLALAGAWISIRRDARAAPLGAP